jgi:uncharacterized protein (DUF305 family)
MMSQADQAFLAGMLEHHQKVVDMSRSYLAAARPGVRDARVARMAKATVKARMAEMKDMQGWLKDAGVSLDQMGMGDAMVGD